jgi:hypothetical protein
MDHKGHAGGLPKPSNEMVEAERHWPTTLANEDVGSVGFSRRSLRSCTEQIDRCFALKHHDNFCFCYRLATAQKKVFGFLSVFWLRAFGKLDPVQTPLAPARKGAIDSEFLRLLNSELKSQIWDPQ